MQTNAAVMVRGRWVAARLLAAGLLLALPGVSAHAAGPDGAAPPTRLRLTVEGGPAVTLRCDPPGGTHPRAAAACRAVAAVDGHLERLPRRPGVFCPALYDPVTAQATGRWRGRPVSYRATFGNRCELKARTGLVFDF